LARFLGGALVGLFCWLTVTAFSPSSLSAESALRACLLPPPACKAIVVLSPHPDDETLGFGGLIRESLQKGKAVWIIEATSGDAYEGACTLWNLGKKCSPEDLKAFGKEREKEVIESIKRLTGSKGLLSFHTLPPSVPKAPGPYVLFLGYPDTGLERLWKTPHTLIKSTSSRQKPYIGTAYSGDSLLASLKALFLFFSRHYRGLAFFTTDRADTHPDHSALYLFTREAIARAGLSRATLYTTIIHSKVTGWIWPTPSHWACEGPNLVKCREAFGKPLPPPPDHVVGDLCMFPLSLGTEKAKARAIRSFRTQFGTISRTGGPHHQGRQIALEAFMMSFAKSNELFWKKPLHLGLPY